MESDFSLIKALVPDVLKILRRRYLILEQIGLDAPVGRRTVAQKLGLSERNVKISLHYYHFLVIL